MFMFVYLFQLCTYTTLEKHNLIFILKQHLQYKSRIMHNILGCHQVAWQHPRLKLPVFSLCAPIVVGISSKDESILSYQQ